MRGYVRELHGFGTQVINYVWPSGPSDVYSGYPVAGVSSFSRSEITKNPEWARRLRGESVWVPPTNYDVEKYRTDVCRGSHLAFGSYNVISTGTIGPVFSGLGLIDTALPSTAQVHSLSIIKALSKLKDQNVNLAMAFAERKKTSALICKTMLSVASGAKKLKKGDVRGACQALGCSQPRKGFKGKDFTSKWLELQYGWKPLLMDVHGSADELAEKDQTTPDRYRITVNGFSKHSTIDRNDRATASANVTEFSNKKVRSRTNLTYVPLDLPGLIQASALGLTNPADLAWNLLPFSFMVDWFIPIGDLLSVLDAALPYQFVGGYTADIAENASIGAFNGLGSTVGYASERSYRYKYTRNCYGVSPFPDPWVLALPKTDAGKQGIVANTLAILASVFK